MEVLDKLKIHMKSKARMNVPFYWVVVMPIILPTLKIDVAKMEQHKLSKWVIGKVKRLSMYHHKIGGEKQSQWLIVSKLVQCVNHN
jgi:hypothetical protein